MAAVAVDRRLEQAERAGAAGATGELPIGVIDRWMLPDHDPGLVERVQYLLAEQVVRARDVRADRAQLGDDRVDVAAGQRGAPAVDVLLDRGAVQPQALAVEIQDPALDLDRAEPDLHRVRLLDGRAGG